MTKNWRPLSPAEAEVYEELLANCPDSEKSPEVEDTKTEIAIRIAFEEGRTQIAMKRFNENMTAQQLNRSLGYDNWKPDATADREF